MASLWRTSHGQITTGGLACSRHLTRRIVEVLGAATVTPQKVRRRIPVHRVFHVRVDPSCERADAAVLMQIGIMLGYITGGIFVQARAQQCCCPAPRVLSPHPQCQCAIVPMLQLAMTLYSYRNANLAAVAPSCDSHSDTVAAGAWPGVLEARHRCSGIQFPTNHFERIVGSIARHEKTGILNARH